LRSEYSRRVKVLSIVHGDEARTELFAPHVRAKGHELEEWSLAWGTPLPRPLDDYDAVLIFGGAMHADQDDRHPWLREENMLLEQLLDRHVPMLGVCLGAQLIAKAAHASVHAASEPEIGWHEVELTDDAADDPVFSRLPQRFPAFQWHYYTHDVPAGAVELARSSVCTQAFRLGDAVWGVQFHPEVTEPQISTWLAQEELLEPEAPRDRIAADTPARIGEWNQFGRMLCGAWLEVAERAATPV
jgi:GMP synthase-like glutamine amidotransferase